MESKSPVIARLYIWEILLETKCAITLFQSPLSLSSLPSLSLFSLTHFAYCDPNCRNRCLLLFSTPRPGALAYPMSSPKVVVLVFIVAIPVKYTASTIWYDSMEPLRSHQHMWALGVGEENICYIEAKLLTSNLPSVKIEHAVVRAHERRSEYYRINLKHSTCRPDIE